MFLFSRWLVALLLKVVLALVAPNLGVGGLGPAVGAGGSTVDDQIRQITSAISLLQVAMATRSSSASSDDARGRVRRAKSRERGKSKDKKDKKKKKRSKSSSSSSSASSASKVKPLRWEERGSNKQVSPAKLARTDIEKFKKRSDLLVYAELHPGALAAHLLNLVRVKSMKGQVSESKQLRQVDVSSYVANGHMGLTDLRDTREATTLALAIDYVNRSQFEKAMDVLTMRLVALSKAKSKGGSWEKAQRGELIPEPGHEMAPTGMSGLYA